MAIAYQSCCFIGSWYAAIFLDFYDLTQEPIPELIQNTKALIDAARQSNIPVVYTAQPGNQSPEYRQLLTDFWGPGLKDEPNITQIFPKFHLKNDTVLTKWRYSVFKFSPLEQLMRDSGRDQLIICGVYAHIGCLMSAAEAFMLNIQPFYVVMRWLTLAEKSTIWH